MGKQRTGKAARWSGASLLVLAALGSAAPAWSQVEEITVTANRRVQNLQDVAASLDVLQGKTVEKLGYDKFEDYLSTISNLGYSKDGRGAVKIGIRGMSNVAGSSTGIGSSVSTVGLYLNDVPIQGSGGMLDLGLFDLQRIEVLKGPQGTLYGEGSMGGAIKMILNTPDLQRTSAKLQGELSSTDGGGTNYQAHATVNAPIVNDMLGLRVTATYRNDGGYVKNAIRGGTNGDEELTAFRGMLRAQLNENFTADFLVLHQKSEADNFNDVRVGDGDLRNNTPDNRFNDQTFNLFGLTLGYDLGFAKLTSATAYWKGKVNSQTRSTGVVFDNFSLLDFNLPGFKQTDQQGFATDIQQKSFTEELRLSSSGTGRFQWTLGGIYHSLKTSGFGYDVVSSSVVNAQIQANATRLAGAFRSVGGTVAGALLRSDTDVYASAVSGKTEGYAGFANASYEFLPGVSVEVGGRAFRDKVSFSQADTAYGIFAYDFALFAGPLGPNNTFDAGKFSASATDSGLIGKAGLTWKIDPRHMVYAQASQGYRSGGANYIGGRTGVPPLFKHDSSWNYEIGTKNSFLDGRVTLNGALFWTDWSDIQLRVSASPASYLVNAGDARLYGGELSLNAILGEGFTYGLNLGALRSKLTSISNTKLNAVVGAPISNAPKSTVSTFLQYERPVGSIGNGVLRVDYQYTAKQAVTLITRSTPYDSNFVDSYSTLKLQAGIEGDHWQAYLFVNNLTDERGQLGKTYSNPNFSGYTAETTLQLIRPRTIGARLSLQF